MSYSFSGDGSNFKTSLDNLYQLYEQDSSTFLLESSKIIADSKENQVIRDSATREVSLRVYSQYKFMLESFRQTWDGLASNIRNDIKKNVSKN